MSWKRRLKFSGCILQTFITRVTPELEAIRLTTSIMGRGQPKFGFGAETGHKLSFGVYSVSVE